jgi:hypothetical protein
MWTVFPMLEVFGASHSLSEPPVFRQQAIDILGPSNHEFKLMSQNIIYKRKCQDMKTILKAGWQRKTGYFGYVPTQSIFTKS